LARLHAACMAVRPFTRWSGQKWGSACNRRVVACTVRAWRFGFFSPGPACMMCGTQPPRRGRVNLGACWRRLDPQRLRAQVGRVAFKRGAIPLEGHHVFALPPCIVPFHLPSPPGGGRPDPFRLVVGGTQLRGSWYLSAIIRLQGFSSCSMAASPRRWSPKTVTTSLMVGESKPGYDLCPSLSLKDFHHQCWGGECAELRSVPVRAAARSFPQ
jgi:hypothetical protein